MIQRLQSISLILATIFICLGITLIPYLNLAQTENTSIHCFYGTIIFRLIGCIITLIACTTFFSYKKRKNQIRLCNINIFLLISLLLFQIILYEFHDLGGESFFEIFPFLSLLCIFDARRRIKKDEALVRAADRLR